MHQFKDNKGDVWTVEFEIPVVKEVRKLLGVDLLADKFTDTLDALKDTVLLVDVLYLACREQAEHRGIDDLAFGRRLKGDPIDAATIAVLRALTDFFPQHRRAVFDQMITQVVAKEKLANEALMKFATSPELEALVDQVYGTVAASAGGA